MLLPGDDVRPTRREMFDLDTLVAMFEALTGREATAAEIEETRRELEAMQPDIDAALRDGAKH